MFRLVGIIFICCCMHFPEFLSAGNGWELKKEENGIRVYTKDRENSDVYMYKVETVIGHEVGKVYRQVIDFKENLRYIELVDSIGLLESRKDERYMAYLHFDLPWPVKNRHMVMDMTVEHSPERIALSSVDLPEKLASKQGTIAIEDFQEEWIIEPVEGFSETRITLTGWIDPGGSVPAWIVNRFSTRTPFRFILGIVEELNKDS